MIISALRSRMMPAAGLTVIAHPLAFGRQVARLVRDRRGRQPHQFADPVAAIYGSIPACRWLFPSGVVWARLTCAETEAPEIRSHAPNGRQRPAKVSERIRDMVACLPHPGISLSCFERDKAVSIKTALLTASGTNFGRLGERQREDRAQARVDYLPAAACRHADARPPAPATGPAQTPACCARTRRDRNGRSPSPARPAGYRVPGPRP